MNHLGLRLHEGIWIPVTSFVIKSLISPHFPNIRYSGKAPPNEGTRQMNGFYALQYFTFNHMKRNKRNMTTEFLSTESKISNQAELTYQDQF